MALMKAVRGAEIKLDTLNRPYHGDEDIRERLKVPDDNRLFTIFEALKKGVSVDEIYDITKIDKWFLHKLNHLVAYENRIALGLSDEDYRLGKQLGYPRSEEHTSELQSR